MSKAIAITITLTLVDGGEHERLSFLRLRLNPPVPEIRGLPFSWAPRNPYALKISK